MKAQDKSETKDQKHKPDEPAYRRKLIEMIANILPSPRREPEHRESLVDYWRFFGRFYLPGLFFPDPTNSIINLTLYSLLSVALALMQTVFSSLYAGEAIGKLVFVTLMFSLVMFMFLSFGNFFILLVWSQIRYSDARKRALYFTLPYYLLFIGIYIHDTWNGNVWQSLLAVLRYTPCMGLTILIFGVILGFSSQLFPPLSKKSALILLGISLLGSIGMVFWVSFQMITVMLKHPAIEYFTTITLENVIEFSVGVVLVEPVAFWAVWGLYRGWLDRKQALIDYLQQYRRLYDAIVEFVKGINFNRNYYKFWMLFAIPFVIALAHNIFYYYFPWLEQPVGTRSEWLPVTAEIILMFTQSLLIASALLLLLITFEYIFIPDAIKSIKVQVPRFISRPVYKAVVVLLLLFTAWLCFHSLMIYTIQFWHLLDQGSGEGYLDLLGSFFYVFSHMTGYDLTDYKPVDLIVRLYTVLIALTGIFLLIIFLGTALSSQEGGKSNIDSDESHPQRRVFYTSMRLQNKRRNQKLE